MEPLEFVKEFYPLAHVLENSRGIPALQTLTQWAHESGYNTSVLSSVHHNLGGVKFADWQEAYGAMPVNLQTWEFREDNEVLADFAAFPSYDAYSHMYAELLSFPRYLKTRQYANDPKGYFQALKDGGYATDPDYVSKLMRVLEELRGAFNEVSGVYREPPTLTTPEVRYAFADIPEGHWATGDWDTAIKHGLIKGYADGTYHPDQQTTRSEMVAFGVRLAEYIYGRIKELIEDGGASS